MNTEPLEVRATIEAFGRPVPRVVLLRRPSPGGESIGFAWTASLAPFDLENARGATTGEAPSVERLLSLVASCPDTPQGRRERRLLRFAVDVAEGREGCTPDRVFWSRPVPMPTLCPLAGPLPESLRPFLDESGQLRAGDATGLEAQWILSVVTIADGSYYPESEWTLAQIAEDEAGVGCVRCGDEEAATIRGLCWFCS